MRFRCLVIVSALAVAPSLQPQERGRIEANVTMIAVSPTSTRSDITATYMPYEPHCSSNCLNELAGSHQIVQYGSGMVAGIYFRTSSATYRGSLNAAGEPQRCYYGLADQMTYTFKNPPPEWDEANILASRNDVRSPVRCTPAASSPTPVYDTPGSNPDGSKAESPIVIDIAQKGYELTSPADGVEFDIRSSGTPVQVAWTKAGVENAFLALDRNGNGRVDHGAELFGNHTPLMSGSRAPNGFAALAELDQNGDGSIDPADAIWPGLLLWTDRDHDGLSTAGELQPISASVIAALETDYQDIGKRDLWSNAFRYVARYRDHHGRQHKYYDVYLQTAD